MKRMEKAFEIFKILIASIGTGLTWLFGAWDTAIAVLIFFMIADYVSGVVCGFINKELSSDVGLKGLSRKFLIILVLMGAVALDRLTGTGQWVFRSLVCYFYIANEGISLLENATRLGLPVPPKLKDALVQLKDGNKKAVEPQEEKK